MYILITPPSHFVTASSGIAGTARTSLRFSHFAQG